MPRPFNSPLRYPGSKANLVDWVVSFLEENALKGVEFVEPYAGSASLSLNLLSRGVISSAMLFERDPLLFSFWYSVFNRTEELISLIERNSVSMETRAELAWLLKLDHVHDDVVQMGFAGLIFNRTSFSGVLHAGPIGGASQNSRYKVDCRFNKSELIARIRACSDFSERVQVYFGDAVKALSDARNVDCSNRLFYVDPPYYLQGPKLYRYHYSFSDHIRLSEVLSEVGFNWLLSYDDHPAIRHLYRKFAHFQPSLRYSTKVPKKEFELILTNVVPLDHSTRLAPTTPQSADSHVGSDPNRVTSLVELRP